MTATLGSDLPTLELVIEQHLPSVLKAWGDFATVGKTLATIRDERLFSQRTFERYLHERWGLSRARGYQLIAAAGVASTLVDSDLPPPVTERVARELTPLLDHPPELVATWQEALKQSDGAKVTAETVCQARRRRRETPRRHDRDERQSPRRERREAKQRQEQFEYVVNLYVKMCQSALWLNVTDPDQFAIDYVNEVNCCVEPKAARMGRALFIAFANRVREMEYFGCVDGDEDQL